MLNRNFNLSINITQMIKLDPIIAVKDVKSSAKWYERVFGFKRNHGGEDFAVLINEDQQVMLCLHKWGEHQHPTLTNEDQTTGNGLLLYFKTDNLEAIRQNAHEEACVIEEEIHTNTNSQKREFSLRDPDGYYLTISEYHEY